MAIKYSKVGWNVSPYKYANPTNMNQMDSGIKAACDGVDALASVPYDIARNGCDEWSGSINLIKYPYFRESGYTQNGITFTYDDSGVINLNGTSTDSATFAPMETGNFDAYIPIEDGVTYRVIFEKINVAEGTLLYFKHRFVNSEGVEATGNHTSATTGFYFTGSSDIRKFGINVGVYGAGGVCNNAQIKVMLVKQTADGKYPTVYQRWYKSNKTLTDNVSDKDGIAFLGWSCPDAMPVKNYRDASGVFHQRVGRVDMGSLTWYTQATTDGTGIRFYALLNPDGKHPSASGTKANLYCSKYVTGTNSDTASKVKCVAYHQSANLLSVYDSSYTDATQFRTAMSGQYLYYELNSEITFADGKEAPILKNASKTYTFTNGVADSGIPLTNVPLSFLPTSRSGYAFTFINASNVSATNWTVYGFNLGGVITGNASGTVYYL